MIHALVNINSLKISNDNPKMFTLNNYRVITKMMWCFCVYYISWKRNINWWTF